MRVKDYLDYECSKCGAEAIGDVWKCPDCGATSGFHRWLASSEDELRKLALAREQLAEDFRVAMLAGVTAEFEAMKSYGWAKWMGAALMSAITLNWRPEAVMPC